MRLIDADELITLTQKDMEFAFNNGFLDMAFEREHLIKVIRNQPTAYDIEKVVAELKELDDKSITRYKNGNFGDFDGVEYYIKKRDAIKIVKNGGARKEF